MWRERFFFTELSRSCARHLALAIAFDCKYDCFSSDLASSSDLVRVKVRVRVRVRVRVKVVGAGCY